MCSFVSGAIGTLIPPTFRSFELSLLEQVLLNGNLSKMSVPLYLSVFGSGILRSAADLDVKGVVILTSKEGEARGCARVLLQFRRRKNGLDPVQKLTGLACRPTKGQPEERQEFLLTLCSSNSVRLLSLRLLLGCFEPARRVRLSPSSLTLIAEIVASDVRVRITFPDTKSRLVKCHEFGLCVN